MQRFDFISRCTAAALRCASRLTVLVLLAALACHAINFAQPSKLDQAAWGSDHVGKPVPEFTSGDECLFCHRMDVGPTWGNNRHNLTIRSADPKTAALAAMRDSGTLKQFTDEIEFVLGDKLRQRFLKTSGAGKLAMLSAEWAPPGNGKPGSLLNAERPHWDSERFGMACAGCHATGVDAKDHTFMARSLDCFACHGQPPEQHTIDAKLAYLSPKRTDPARVVTSICAQCHVRTGQSKSTELPYANNFVAGDNLFRDFRVDLADDAITKLNPGDAHVLLNVRDVTVLGKEAVTCLTCHDVHKQSTKKHHLVRQDESCVLCHNAEGSKKIRKSFAVHSTTCGY